jgi:hypothetical protein
MGSMSARESAIPSVCLGTSYLVKSKLISFHIESLGTGKGWVSPFQNLGLIARRVEDRIPVTLSPCIRPRIQPLHQSI